MSEWWNVNYLFRRRLRIVPDASYDEILAGHPIHVKFNRARFLATNKLRLDNNDLEIVFSPEMATPISHTPVPFKMVNEPTSDSMDLVFNAVEDITGPNEDYYLYFNNPTMTAQPVKAAFVESDYVISLTPTNYNNNVTFSRPNEDWDLGVSDTINARAALRFYGPTARLKVEKGPDRGILEVKVDGGAVSYVDTYNYTNLTSTVYTTSGLGVGEHYMRLRLTGDKHPASSGYSVKLVSFDFSNYAEAILLAEEIKSTATPINTIVGP